MVTSFLVELCQQHLVHALRDRIQHTEQMVGNQFGFEIIQRDVTTVFLAHHWPHAQDKPAFHRVFNYLAPSDSTRDVLLERLVDEQLDAIVEVLPGPYAHIAEQVLRAYHFQPVWSIPWLYMPVQQFASSRAESALVQLVQPHNLAHLADVLIAAYEYDGDEATAWHTFATYGYGAPGFFSFLATIQGQPAAAGILHLFHDSALVDGAATLPAYRGRGFQKALLSARLLYAKAQGSVHAFSRTGLGSISQSNLHSIGMQTLTHSTAWRRL